jgi:hypothetical protein
MKAVENGKPRLVFAEKPHLVRMNRLINVINLIYIDYIFVPYTYHYNHDCIAEWIGRAY